MASRKNGKFAHGTSSLATSSPLPPQMQPPRPRTEQPVPSCAAGQLAPPKRDCPSILNISRPLLYRSSAASPATSEPPFLFATSKAKSKYSSKPAGAPSNPSATLPAPTSKPPSSPPKLPPCLPASTAASLIPKLPYPIAHRRELPPLKRSF